MKKSIRIVTLFAAVVLLATGCVNKNSHCVKSEGHSISAGMYIYQLSQQKSSYLSQNSLTESEDTWDSEYSEELTVGEYIQTVSLDSLVNTLIWREQFDKLELAFSEEEKKNIEDNIDTMVKDAGGEELVKESLETYGISYDEFVESVYYDTQKILKVVDYYYGENGVEPVGEAEILAYFTDNYARVKHILISTVDADGNELTADAMKKVKNKAQSVFESAKNADEKGFDKLIKEHNEDEGVAAYPNGYVFTTGEMVDEFEKAAFDMKVGETRLVQSEYGFHIMRKLTLDDEEVFTPEIRKNMLMNLKSEEIADMFDAWKEETNVKVNRSVLTRYTCKNTSIGEDVALDEQAQLEAMAEQLGLTEEDKVSE